MITLKRVYDKPDETDGRRVLVDRLWPRGLSKEKAKIDFWWKEIAPSDELRKWFSHDPGKWSEFKKNYISELKNKKDLLQEINNFDVRDKNLALLYGAKDEEHNNAVVLKEFLLNEFSSYLSFL